MFMKKKGRSVKTKKKIPAAWQIHSKRWKELMEDKRLYRDCPELGLTKDDLEKMHSKLANRDFLLDLQKKVFSRALAAVLEKIPHGERRQVKLMLNVFITGYPIEDGDGNLDHLVFLPKGMRQEHYYQDAMDDVLFMLHRISKSDDLSQIFKNEIERTLSIITDWCTPYIEARRKIDAQLTSRLGEIARQRTGRWELNEFEKSLVKAGVMRLDGELAIRLVLRKCAVSREEREGAQGIVSGFFEGKTQVTKEMMGAYEQTYQDLKTNFRLVPFFIEHIYRKFNGAFVFLDRDARILYKAAILYGKLIGDMRSQYLVPITRPMIPKPYMEAHMNEVGRSMPFGDLNKSTSYHWQGDEATWDDSKKFPINLKISEAKRSSQFKAEGTKLFSFLEKIGVLNHEEIAVIDMGEHGSATDYTADVIRCFSPESTSASYLFYGSKPLVPAFNNEMLPFWKMLPLDYDGMYEAVPKPVPMVREFEKRDGIWIPKYERLSEKGSKWVHGIVGEVHLGVRLLELSVKNLIVEYLQNKG
jgi:hypothetical protein